MNRHDAIREIATSVDGILARATTDLQERRDALQEELNDMEIMLDNDAPNAPSEEAIESMQEAVALLDEMIDRLSEGAQELDTQLSAART
jgi:prefoldin subunit 5